MHREDAVRARRVLIEGVLPNHTISLTLGNMIVVCVCLREREEREGGRGREREGGREGGRERERERESDEGNWSSLAKI